MLMQVLSLTPDQINSLPPTERDAIQQLVSALDVSNYSSKIHGYEQRNQFMSGITV